VTLIPGRRQIGPFTVTAGHVAHPVEAFAFRFEHAGRVLTYSGDTGESPVLIELAKSADVLLCEAVFPNCRIFPRACTSAAGRRGGTPPWPEPGTWF
jgi:ribonuclease BN (tRNA processing enzyme)